VLPASSEYAYDTVTTWAHEVFSKQEEMSKLLGPWAAVPIPEDYTFGVELEFALHGTEGKPGAVQMAQSIQEWRSVRDKDAQEITSNYLLRMGVNEGWR
jgi:hypothetical protein